MDTRERGAEESARQASSYERSQGRALSAATLSAATLSAAMGRTLRSGLCAFLGLAGWLGQASPVQARPNTHAPAISTWDPRASSVVFALGRAASGTGSFTYTSYSANFSSTNGVLSAQFGAHYTTFRATDDGPTARGVSAGGVALISLPLSERFDNGVPHSAFAFYVGGVPTAMFSGQLNFISVPLVLGVGLPFSPSRYITFRPWVELSPGLNFDTRIQEVATADAIQSAMDGTLTRDEVEALVEEGLDIQRETTVGKRAGLSFAAHLGERVDFDVNVLLGAGHAGAFVLGAGLTLRWDRMVHELDRERPDEDRQRLGEPASCAALAAAYHQRCRLRASPSARPGGERMPRRGAPARGAPTRAAPAPAQTSPARPGGTRSRGLDGTAPPRQQAPLPASSASPAQPSTPRVATTSSAPATNAPATKTKKPPATTADPPTAPARPSAGELPPLQAAPPRTP